MPGLFAPAEPLAVRRLTLIELLKIDLEYRHNRASTSGWKTICRSFLN